MKNYITLFVLILAGFGFYACSEDSVSELLEKDLSISEKIEIPVHIDKTDGTWATFDNTKEISIDNAQTHDYLNRIKSVKIVSVALYRGRKVASPSVKSLFTSSVSVKSDSS